jgi:hypothetical protein
MTSLASRQPYPAALGSAGMAPTATHYRVPPSATTASSSANHNLFTSPTESEFSESYRDNAAESVQDWDESRVGDWLKSIGCGQYVDVFRRNNINGENLMDMDQQMLKEMGIKKIGDRVRIGAQAKVFRNNVYKKASKKSINRVREIASSNIMASLTSCSTPWQHSTASPNSHPLLLPLHDPCTPPASLERHSQRSVCPGKFLLRIHQITDLFSLQRQCPAPIHLSSTRTAHGLECSAITFLPLWIQYERNRTAATSLNHLQVRAGMAAAGARLSKRHKPQDSKVT